MKVFRTFIENEYYYLFFRWNDGRDYRIYPIKNVRIALKWGEDFVDASDPDYLPVFGNYEDSIRHLIFDRVDI